MDDRKFLRQAIELAKTSKEPLGCASILVNQTGKVVARAINTQRAENRTAAHAEMNAIMAANKLMGRKLHGLTAYGNCEPCTMCLTALIFTEVDRIVFAKRLNDFLEDNRKIAIDCFEFVKQFPKSPKLELLEV